MIVNGEHIETGLEIISWMDDKLVRKFKSRPRRGGPRPTEIVVHESVTTSAAKTMAVLSAKGYGVHFMVDLDGTITQHVDVARATAHAGGKHNDQSVGIEIVNPYYGSRALPGQQVIEAPWAHKGLYAVPFSAQVESLAGLFRELFKLGIEPTFVGASKGKYVDHETGLTMGKLVDKTPRPGVWAHTYFDHGDGAWPVKEAYKLWKM